MAAFHPYHTPMDHALGSSSSVSPGDSDNVPLVNDHSYDGEGGVGKWNGGPKAAPVKAACLSCRTKKAKCDGKQPVCGQCARKNLECVFVKSRRGGARKRRQVVPPTALSTFLKKLDGLIAVPAFEHAVSLTPAADPSAPPDDPTNVVKQFSTREEVFNQYYSDIHPYVAVMPQRNYLGQILPTLLPASPFLLAVQTILVLVPHPNDPTPNSASSKRQRQNASLTLAQQSYQLIDSMVEAGTVNLECVQALTILALWEWSNSGSVAKNHSRSGQAIQIAMQLGLHELDKYTGTSTGLSVEGDDWQRDMVRRTWWVTYVSQLTAAVVSGSSPVVGPDDPRIMIDYPASTLTDNSWPNFINTVRQCIRIFAMVNAVYFPHLTENPAWGPKDLNGDSPTAAPVPDSGDTPERKAEIRQQMYEIDKKVLDLLKEAEASSVIDLVPGGEEEVVRNQQLQARLALAVVHIHIHRFQAFPEVSLFSKRICGLPQAPDFSATSGAGTPSTLDGSYAQQYTSPASSANLTTGQSDMTMYTEVSQGAEYAATSQDTRMNGIDNGQYSNSHGAHMNGNSDGYSGQYGSEWKYDSANGFPDQQMYNDYVMDDVFAPETYPENLPAPWFTYPGGAASLYAPLMQEPTHYPEVTASIVPIMTPPSASVADPSSGSRRASSGSSAIDSKPHKAWGVDEKADKVLPPPDSQMMDVFPPGISLARCATAAHTIVRLEVLHRSAVMAMWDGPPKWPPFCSCGLVTGAYAFLLLALAVQAENTFTGYTNSRSEEVEALLTNVKVILAGLEAYGTMWAGIDAMAGEVRAALEAATRLPFEVQAQIESSGTPEES
ncbi:hypothetical protein IAU60_001406 [Kwoniella sp. DSM 27419]